MENKTVTLKVGDIGVPQDHISFVEEGYGERHFVRSGDVYVEVTSERLTPVYAHRNRSYLIKDTNSFIAYVEKYGDPGKGIIFVDDSRIVMFFEERSRVENVVLPFKLSLEVKSFLGSHGATQFDQKEFVRVLETFPDVVKEHKTLLPVIERLKLEATMEFESNLDDRDHVFMYREKSGKQTARIPKRIVLMLPYFERSKCKTTIETDLEIRKPRNAEERPVFILTDPKHERTYREALEAEVGLIQEALKGWMFVYGTPAV